MITNATTTNEHPTLQEGPTEVEMNRWVNESQPKETHEPYAPVGDPRQLGSVPIIPVGGSEEEYLGLLAQKLGVSRCCLQWKIDAVVLPSITLMYFISFLDRINISSANAYGMGQQIGVTGMSWNVCLTVFYVPYVVLALPANIVMKYVSPAPWLAFCTVAFSAITLATAWARSYGALITIRVLLGVLEAGMVPGGSYLLAQWYTKREAMYRYAFFYCSTAFAGAFGGLIAYGMNTLQDKRGLKNWQWLYIIEGAISMFIGLLFFLTIPNFPEKSWLLNENERAFVLEKLERDHMTSGANEKITCKKVLAVFKDVKVYLGSFMYFGMIISGYGYAYFAQALLKTMGYDSLQVQIHSIYPWIVAGGLTLIVGLASDYFQHRFGFFLFTACVAFVGYGIMLGTEPTPHYHNARYAALFLIAPGALASFPLCVCWMTLHFVGHTRKLTATAWQIGFANTGGIVATFIFQSKDAPAYRTGIWVSLALGIFAFVSAIIYFIFLFITNRNKRAGKYDAWWAALPEDERVGDLNPSYIYMY